MNIGKLLAISLYYYRVSTMLGTVSPGTFCAFAYKGTVGW